MSGAVQSDPESLPNSKESARSWQGDRIWGLLIGLDVGIKTGVRGISCFQYHRAR